MTFQPIIPVQGLAGWKYVTRTLDEQIATLSKSPEHQRDTAYFADRIGAISNAQQLVADRRLLRVALGAFGLQGDIDSRAFIKQILEQGTSDPSALANRLTDGRYFRLAEAFGFDEPSPGKLQRPGFAADIVKRYLDHQFEERVGEQDNSMRLALNARRDLAEIGASTASESVKLYRILGSSPLRKVMETALSLPSQFSQIDIDQQVAVIREKLSDLYGIQKFDEFTEKEVLEDFLQGFIIRDQVADMTTQVSSNSTALALLRA